MAYTAAAPEALWRRAVRSKRLPNNSLKAISALVAVLRRAGEQVSFVEVRNWSRQLQGEAYLWAIDRLHGVKGRPAPWGNR